LQLVERISINHIELLERETMVLQLACAWADVHDIDTTGPDYQPLVERAWQFGGAGTPEVSEYCAAGFGVLQGLSSMTGRLINGNALALRHRLPELCRDLDQAITAYLGGLMCPWRRFQRILDAAILQADPEQAAARTLRARTEREVWAMEPRTG
jgi:hypothetical protein